MYLLLVSRRRRWRRRWWRRLRVPPLSKQAEAVVEEESGELEMDAVVIDTAEEEDIVVEVEAVAYDPLDTTDDEDPMMAAQDMFFTQEEPSGAVETILSTSMLQLWRTRTTTTKWWRWVRRLHSTLMR